MLWVTFLFLLFPLFSYSALDEVAEVEVPPFFEPNLSAGTHTNIAVLWLFPSSVFPSTSLISFSSFAVFNSRGSGSAPTSLSYYFWHYRGSQFAFSSLVS